MPRAAGITILDVMRDMGVALDKHVTWAVGSAIQRSYAAEMGHQPPKDNRRKTSGAGSHCFAIYPNHWRGRIEEAVRGAAATSDAQGSLFGKSNEEI